MAGLEQQSADVRFTEIDLSQSLVNASTANGAMILASRKGRPTRYNVTTWTDFVAEYGERDAAVSFGHYCAKDFFDGGNSLDVVRAVGVGAKWSAALVKDDGSGNTSAVSITAGIDDPDNIDWDSLITGAEKPLFLVYPKSGQGSHGDALGVRVLSANVTPATGVTATAEVGGDLPVGTMSYRVSVLSEIGETIPSTAVTATTTSTDKTVRVQWASQPMARGYNVYGRTGGSEKLMASFGAETLEFVDTGILTPDADSILPTVAPTPTTEFTLQIFDNDVNPSIPQEEWTCTLRDFVDGTGVQLEVTQRINPYSDMVSVATYVPFLAGTPPTLKVTSKVSLDGGDSGAAPTNGQIAELWPAAFGDREKVQVNILINAGYTAVEVQQAMLTLARTREDAFAILDMPSGMQKYQDAITYRQMILNANTSYGAIYSSDPYVSDGYNGKQLYVPPSGKVAAIYARTDAQYGPQFAPAGLNRGQVDALALRVDYDESQRTKLFKAQVNYIRTFVGLGRAVFEQVTLQAKPSALSWVNVRRMVNTIKTAVRSYLIYNLHDPNDDFLRQSIVTSLTDYLQFWKDARGISDFTVICDTTNNPPSRYNLGILKVTVVITPIISVHEIAVDMVISKQGLSVSEINISALG